MLLPLPIVFMLTVPVATSPGTIPQLDIARECRTEGGAQIGIDGCISDEKNAREQLKEEWRQFAAGDKSRCLQEAQLAGMASYVELLTCLEMVRDTKKTSE
jgi:hypothetical protein